jgi:hypothetical protein
MTDTYSDDELRELFATHLSQNPMAPDLARELQRKVLLEASKLNRSTPPLRKGTLPFIGLQPVPSGQAVRQVMA